MNCECVYEQEIIQTPQQYLEHKDELFKMYQNKKNSFDISGIETPYYKIKDIFLIFEKNKLTDLEIEFKNKRQAKGEIDFWGYNSSNDSLSIFELKTILNDELIKKAEKQLIRAKNKFKEYFDEVDLFFSYISPKDSELYHKSFGQYRSRKKYNKKHKYIF